MKKMNKIMKKKKRKKMTKKKMMIKNKFIKFNKTDFIFELFNYNFLIIF